MVQPIGRNTPPNPLKPRVERDQLDQYGPGARVKADPYTQSSSSI
uniref:Uncharacterized protein n=1 Tax=Anopheles albimanus TaxID=7167 RepID=A0A182FY58_ANOAL